ncbi:hypothetical protein PJP10_31450, partial [Mycobacterium kansasii]
KKDKSGLGYNKLKTKSESAGLIAVKSAASGSKTGTTLFVIYVVILGIISLNACLLGGLNTILVKILLVNTDQPEE